MNHRNKIFILVIVVFILIFFMSWGCKKSEQKKYHPSEATELGKIKPQVAKNEEGDLIRIVDILEEKNIIESAVKNLKHKFKYIEENIQDNWKLIKKLSTPAYDLWGFSTSHKILGNPKKDVSPNVKLFKNGKKVDYSNSFLKNRETWNWVNTSSLLNLKSDKRFNKKHRGLIFKKDDKFHFERILPESYIILKLRIINKDWRKKTMNLIVSIDDSPVKKLNITKKRLYRIVTNVKMGTHKIEIKYDKNNKNISKDDFVVIKMVRIITPSDILFLLKPKNGNRTEPLKGKFKLSYYSSNQIPEGRTRQNFRNNQYLFNFKKKYPILDIGIKDNPYKIKKKITEGEYSYNVILAPPRTEFAVPVKIQDNSYLDFKYGIFNEFIRRPSERVFNFKIVLKTSEEEKLLFEEKASWRGQNKHKSEKIDLSKFSGKKVNINFITEEVSGKNISKLPPVLPIWINPVIYKKQNKKEDINIILVSLDTLRPDHLKCYGYSRETSPNLDKLAEDGVLFQNTFSTTSWTLPGHTSMLTSLNCHRHQVYYPDQKMRDDIQTVADFLRINEFYTSGFSGGGYLSEKYGFSRGFDRYYGIRLYGDKSIREDESELLNKLVVNWVDENQDKKFFLFLHTYQPHDPYANPSKIGKTFLQNDAKWRKIKMVDIFKNGNRYKTHLSKKDTQNIVDLYDGEIKYTDDTFVGPLINKLKQENIYDKSLIIVTSDHGEEFYDHESWLHDHTVYNEAIKIPLIIKFPNSLYKGKKIDQFVRVTDIIPTILDYLKVKSNDEYFDGKSLIPLIEGKEKQNRTFISDVALRNFDTPPDIITMNHNYMKLILNQKIESPYIQRISKNIEGHQIELYDLKNDPEEKNNLAEYKAYRNLCVELVKKIGKYYEKLKLKGGKKKKVKLDEKLRNRLESLGYL